MWRSVLWGLMAVVAAWGTYLMLPGLWHQPQPHEAGVVADQEILESRDLWNGVHQHPARPALSPSGGDAQGGAAAVPSVSIRPWSVDDDWDAAWNEVDAGPSRMGSIYDEYRMERQRLRDQRLEVIQRMSEAPEATNEQRWASQNMMLDLLALQAREIELEYMLKARGYEDAIVSLQGDFANVVLPGILSERDAARIGELVARVAGVPMDRIAIVDGYEIP